MKLVDSGRVAELDAHLDRCPECREVIAELARASGPPSEAPDERSRWTGNDVEAPAPAMIGRFRVERLLGVGGMGAVYLAYDPRLEREVALKVLRPTDAMSPSRQEELLAEARAMARLHHEHLVTVYEIDEVDGQVAIAMEYLAGGSLRRWSQGPRNWREITSVARDIAIGLAAIHESGLVHRDLKPDNLLFDGRGRIRIADLGLALLRNRASGSAGGITGTPAYMAPEQLAGAPADDRTDQWSFFVCLYEALQGVRPFTGTTPAALQAAMAANKSPALGRGPRALRELIVRGLAIDPAGRHASMAKVAHALSRVLGRRALAVRTVGVAALVATAVVITGVASSSREPADPCSGAERHLTKVWDASAATGVQAAFAKAGLDQTGQIVVRGLDEYTRSWVAMHEDSCAATHERGEQSEAMLDRRTLCLDERLGQVETIVTALMAGDVAVLRRASDAITSLPPVADCGDRARLSASPIVPVDPVARARLVEARGAVGRARALGSLGRADDAVSAVEEVIALGTLHDDPTLLAEAHLAAAQALATDLRIDAAGERFAAAELAAEVAGDDPLRARALLGHAAAVSGLDNDPEVAEALLTRARAVVMRLGDRPDLEPLLATVSGVVARRRGDAETAEHLLRDAVAGLERATGADLLIRQWAYDELVIAIGTQGRHEDAAAVARKAIELAEALHGPDFLQLSSSLLLLATSLKNLDRAEEARPLIVRALSLRERALGDQHVSLSGPLAVLAVLDHDAGKLRSARQLLQRAIDLRRVAFGDTSAQVHLLEVLRSKMALDDGDLASAEGSANDAVAVLTSSAGAASPSVTDARVVLAKIAALRGETTCASRFDEARTAIAAAEGPSSPRLAALAPIHARCLWDAGTAAPADRLLTEAAGFAEGADRLAINLMIAHLAYERGRIDGARTLAEEVEMALAEVKPAERIDLELDLAATWAELGEADRAWDLVARAVAAAEADDDDAMVLLRAAEVALLLGRDADASRLAARAGRAAAAAGLGATVLADARCISARAGWRQADHAQDLDRCADDGLAAYGDRWPGLVSVLLDRAEVRVGTKDVPGALADLADAARQAAPIGRTRDLQLGRIARLRALLKSR